MRKRGSTKLLPEDPLGHNDLGYTYYLSKQMDEAIQEYQAVIAIDSSKGIIHYNLALAYQAKGEIGKAIEACLKAQSCGYRGDPNFLARLRSLESGQPK